MGEAALTVTGVASVVKFNFYGDELDVVSDSRGGYWVTLAALCSPLGLRDTKSQADKLKSAKWATTGIIPAVAEDGKVRDVFCLDIRSVAGWLFTVNAGKVRTEFQSKLVRYQRECAEVLADRFIGKRGEASAEIGKLTAKIQILTEERNSARLQCIDADRQVRLLSVSQRSTICDAEFDEVRGLIAEVVDLWLALGRASTKRAALQLVKHRAIPGVFGNGFRLRFLPREQVPGILRALEVLRSDARAEAARRGLIPAPARRRHPVLNLRK